MAVPRPRRGRRPYTATPAARITSPSTPPGFPGFNFIQDPIEYGINTHHTELDTFDHLVIEDLQQAAVVVAATVYALAMRDEMMPRKGSQPVS